MRFVKKLILAVMILAVAAGLAGCVRIEIGMNIHRNGKGDVSFVYALHDTVSSLAEDGSALSPDDLQKYKDEGWDVEDYSGGGYKGYRISKENLDLKESGLLEGSEQILTKEGSLYILDLPLKFGSNSGDFRESADTIRQMGGVFTVRVTLPKKPKSHNATSVSEDGKTLTWDVLSMEDAQSIHAEFRRSVIPVIPVLIALLVIAAAAFVFLMIRKRNEENRRRRERSRARRERKNREYRERYSVQYLDDEFSRNDDYAGGGQYTDGRYYEEDGQYADDGYYPDGGYGDYNENYPDDGYYPGGRGE